MTGYPRTKAVGSINALNGLFSRSRDSNSLNTSSVGFQQSLRAFPEANMGIQITPAFQTQKQWNDARSGTSLGHSVTQSSLEPSQLQRMVPSTDLRLPVPSSGPGNARPNSWAMNNAFTYSNDPQASLGPLELPTAIQSPSIHVPTPLRSLNIYQTPIGGTPSNSSVGSVDVIPMTPETTTRLDDISMVDELEDEEDQIGPSIFLQGTQSSFSADMQLPLNRPAPQGRIRGKLRTKQYSPTEHCAKTKNFTRAMSSISTRLNQVSELHPDVEFMFYVRTKGKRNILKVSNGLKGLDSSSWFTVIHNALDQFSGTDELLPVISFKERYAQDLPPASFNSAFEWFKKHQSVRSMKAIYFTLQDKELVRARIGSPKRPWFEESYQALFLPSSPHKAKQLWDCLHGIQFHRSMGNGTQFKELSRSHFIHLMQALDLLAAAQQEPPLPRDIDFAGNYLQGQASDITGADTIRLSEPLNPNFESDVPQSDLVPIPAVSPPPFRLNSVLVSFAKLD